MMPNLIKAVPLAIICGAGISVATLVVAPQYVGAPLAFAAGVFGGAATASERRIRHQVNQEQSARVSSCFTTLYEKNRGLVDPIELSFLANVPGDRAYAFLAALAEKTNGQKIETKTGIGPGVVFNFSHAQNVLEELSKNANNWVQAQTVQLTQELEAHKQALALMQIKEQQQMLQNNVVNYEQTQDPWTNVKPV